MATQRDLSLAYSPGVAVPVKAIAEDKSRAYDYTTRATWSPSSPTAPPFSASAISARWRRSR
jgi:malic enzyme